MVSGIAFSTASEAADSVEEQTELPEELSDSSQGLAGAADKDASTERLAAATGGSASGGEAPRAWGVRGLQPPRTAATSLTWSWCGPIPRPGNRAECSWSRPRPDGGLASAELLMDSELSCPGQHSRLQAMQGVRQCLDSGHTSFANLSCCNAMRSAHSALQYGIGRKTHLD